jgi:glycosyltransferase involved in cell wall biosynthesis
VTGAAAERTLRVALLAPAYWPEVRRGGERMVHDLGAGLAARGHRVRLLTSHAGRTTTTREDGFDVVRQRRAEPVAARLRRRRYEDHLTHVPLTWLNLRRHDDDIVHAVHHTDAQAAIRSGRPAVWTYLGVPHRAGLANRRLRVELVGQALDRSAAVLALSHAAAREFHRWLGVEPRVIHPGVDLEAFTPGGDRAEALTILCPAALDAPHKRPELLRDAFAHVRHERPGARLVVQRGGPLDDLPGVEPRDLDAHDDLVAAYREAHVTALSSRGEAFGLVLAESLACGTPAVASADAAGPEVVGDGGATFAPAAGARGLAAAILDAAEVSPGICRAQAERFSLERCVAAHEALYRELL